MDIVTLISLKNLRLMFKYQLGDISKYAAVHKRKIFQLNREDFKYFRGCKTGSQKTFYLNHLYLLHIHINSLNKVSLEKTIYIENPLQLCEKFYFMLTN